MANPLRLLHTSDWHLGANFHGQDRSTDEQEALDQIVQACCDHQVDVVLIAGDIFDIANPAADAMQRYFNTLQKLVTSAGVGTVVVIAGNHDSGGRLAAPRDLMVVSRVVVRGTLARNDDPRECIVTLTDREGHPCVVVAAVPYLSERDLELPPASGDMTLRQAAAMEQRFTAINAAARQEAERLQLPVVAMAHCFARSGIIGGNERPVISEAIGNLGQVDLASLATGTAYTALGHLHRPQRVGGKEHWRYSGSLLPTGFDEIHRTCSLTLATVNEGKTHITSIPLTRSRAYANLEGDPDSLRHAIAALPRPTEQERPGFLRAVVHLAEPRPNIAAEIADWARERRWQPLRIERARVDPRRDGQDLQDRAPTTQLPAPETIQPETVFRAAYQQRFPETEPSPALLAAFHELLVADAAEGDV